MNYIAFVTKGLETICQKELERFGVQITSTDQKFIRFSFEGNPALLKDLKTVDDIGLLICEFETASDNLSGLIEFESLQRGIELVKQTRKLAENFSVTVSVYQNPNYDRDKLQQQIADDISDKLALKFTQLDHTNIDLRVNIDHSIGFVSLKLFSESLFRRGYNHQSHFGALRSTIPAAMLFELTDGQKNLKVVDNFCGSGTFLCEAASMGCEVAGSDIDATVINLAKQNLQKVGLTTPQLIVQDATHTNWPNRNFDIAVANFPWGKQIEVKGLATLIDGAIKEYARILKPEAKIGFISAKPQVVLKSLEKYFKLQKLQEFKIGYLGQTPTIQLAVVESDSK